MTRHFKPPHGPTQNGSGSLSPKNASLPAILAERTAENLLAGIGAATVELEKLNAAMDRLMAAKGERVRPAVEALAERLISYLDTTAGDPDLEEDDDAGDGDSDAEPSLGATEHVNQDKAWRGSTDPLYLDGEISLGTPGCYGIENQNQEFSDFKFGSRDECEMHEDDEPSLGATNSTEHHNGYYIGGDDDREDEHDGREPSLGSLNWATECIAVKRDQQGYVTKEVLHEGDQTRWAFGSTNDIELDADHEEGGIEDEPHDADTEEDCQQEGSNDEPLFPSTRPDTPATITVNGPDGKPYVVTALDAFLRKRKATAD